MNKRFPRVHVLIISIIVFFSIPSITLGATQRQVHVQWDYNTSVPELAGFRLYLEGTQVCATLNTDARALDCQILVEDGPRSFSMTAFDSSNNESTHSVSVEVIVTSDGIPANNAPTITGTPATTVVEDSLYSFTPAANDVDPGETLTFSIVNKPSWALFSATTGALTGAPVHANVGITAGIVISVTDTSNANASLPAFTLSVVNGLLAGDVNGSGAVDLEDLYLVQEILAGRTPSQTIHTGADVNGDGNIGMEEALYILQRVSQIR